MPDAPPAQSGVVAVVAGDGNRKLFESLASHVGPISIVEGGQTMNPSTADLLRAAQSLDAEEAILLPNNSNIVLAAEHAAANADRTVEVVPTTSIAAGLAAMVAFDGSRTAAENAGDMREAIATIATGEVTVASRDVQMNGLAIAKGDWLGLADGTPIAGGSDFDDVTYAVVERLLSEPRELLTLLVGSDGAELGGAPRADRGGVSGRRRRRPGWRAAALQPLAGGRVSSAAHMGRPIRILLVEDNQVFREALELLLGMRADIEVVASVGDGGEVVEAAGKYGPEVVLMDYRLPGMDGVQATAALKERYPEIAVVCLTASANAREIEALYAAGAASCLTKDQELDDIVEAVKRAAGGPA